MQRYKGTLAYDGSGYSGYQIQPNARTVQEEIEKVLSKLHKENKVPVTASGRTDAGVHARGQVIHFDSPLNLPSDRWIKALNSQLPSDISFFHVEPAAADFHARFDATGKMYKYFLYTGDIRDPFKRNFAAHYRLDVDIANMRDAAKHFVGTHDFTSFCSAKTDMANKVRTVSAIEIEKSGTDIIFTFVGNGFLYNMVRIIVGTLLDVGTGKMTAADIPDILQAQDRTKAGKTAPAEGLYLWEVYYD